MKEDECKPIPMLDRWKYDVPRGVNVGFQEVTIEEKIDSKKRILNLKVKQGIITQEEADRRMEVFCEELGMLVM